VTSRQAEVDGVGAKAPVAARSRLWSAVSRHPALAVFLLALAVRCATAIALNVVYGGYLFGDERMYTTIALQAAADDRSSWDDYTTQLYGVNGTFLMPLTWAFVVFGPKVIVGQLMVALIGAGVAALTTLLALQALRRAWAVAAGLAVALLPSQILWSSLTLKDAASWLLLVVFALAVAFAARGGGRRLLLAGLVCMVTALLLRYLREHTLVIALWSLALAGAVGVRRGRWTRAVGAVGLMLFFPLAVGLGVGGSGLVADRAGALTEQRALGAIDAETALVDAPLTQALAVREQVAAAAAAERRAEDATKQAQALASEPGPVEGIPPGAKPSAAPGQRPDPAAVERERERRAEAARLLAEAEAARVEAEGLRAEAEAAQEAAQAEADRVAAEQERSGAFGQDTVTGEAGQNLLYLPKGLAILVLGPYPWQGSASAALTFAKAETVLWYPLLALAVVGVLSVRRHAATLLFPLVVGGGVACMWALVEGNFGTAYRHRGELVWVVCLLAAAGGQRLWDLHLPRFVRLP
jgi:hypothetical protein